MSTVTHDFTFIFSPFPTEVRSLAAALVVAWKQGTVTTGPLDLVDDQGDVETVFYFHAAGLTDVQAEILTLKLASIGGRLATRGEMKCAGVIE